MIYSALSANRQHAAEAAIPQLLALASQTLRGIHLVVVVGMVVSCARRSPTCADDTRREAWADATHSCALAYARTHEPRTGLRLATAYLQVGQVVSAEVIASFLITTSEEPAAQLLLGDVARGRGLSERALHRYTLASDAYGARGDDSGRARAAYQLAGAAKELGRYRVAIAAQRLASDSAKRAGDSRMAMYADLARAIILRATGDMVGAEQATSAALSLASQPRDRAWVRLTQGLSYLDADLDALAGPPLHEALSLATDTAITASAHLNLGALARRAGDMELASAELQHAEIAGAETFDVGLLRAQIAVDRGAHAEAAELLARLAAGPLQDRWTWVVPMWQGRNEEARGDETSAERHYRTALAATELLRATSGQLEPHVLVKHREVYERLIGVLARARRWEDALVVIARLQAHQGGTRDMPTEAGTILRAWRDRELVIVVRGGANAWRLDVRDQVIEGIDLGDANVLERWSAALLATPDDQATAAKLGVALLGTRHASSPLYVLVLGSLSSTPLAALRLSSGLAIERRPLIRALGVAPREKDANFDAEVRVIGDPRRNLPGADAEAHAVARHLGIAPQVGPDATTAQVTTAHGRLLHIASHAETTPDGAQLVLADGILDAAAIASLPRPPRIVVLASCGSAAARDLGGWGSLAAGFLAAGSELVIATSWTVRDEPTATLVAELYRQGLVDDPAGALARTQRLLARRTDARDWTAFVALGAPPRR